MNQQILHDEWEEKIIARAAGELSAEESALLDQHIESCVSCAQQLREYDFLTRRLHSVEGDIVVPAPSPELLVLQQEIAQYRIQEEAHQIVEQTLGSTEKEESLMGYSDEQLVGVLQATNRREVDQEVFTVLYERYSKDIYKFLRNTIRDTQDSEDLCHEVFLKVWRGLHHLSSRSKFKPWLYTIAQRTCMDYMRMKKREETRFVSLSQDERQKIDLNTQRSLIVEGQEEQIIEKIVVREVLEAAIRQIPARLEIVLFLRGFSKQEIASAVEVSPLTVGDNIQRGKKALRQAFIAAEEDS